MIRTISIKNTATFDETGIEVSEFKKVNFFYGANGSGKTTISNFIYEPSNPRFPECQLKWENDIELKSLVYNKEFRDRNFGKGTIDGVFTLGQATKEEAELIEEKRKELKELKEKGIQQKSVLDKQVEKRDSLEDDFREEVWTSIYKKHEISFKEAFKGVMQKKPFLARLLDEFENNTSDLKTIEELKERAETILGETPIKIPEIPTIDFERLSEIEQEDIWSKKIIGKSDVEIAKLIQRLNINDWVNEGKKHLQENETCPFCQEETITQSFRNQLESYFDETFTSDTKKTKDLNDDYVRIFENIINELLQIESTEKINKKTKLDLDKFSSLLKTLNSQFLTNKELLNSKLREPSRIIELISTKEQLEEIEQLITTANALIKKHNDIVDNYATERNKLVNEIWKFIIEDNRTRIEYFVKHKNGLQKGIDNIAKKVTELREEYKKLDKEIKELTKNVTSIQPSVDEINQTLKSFGFQNFEIVPSQIGANQYQIQRTDGELAESTLSEGEITFITFLYFLQLVKGSTNEAEITDERILVIDDPISSLDSNVLFVVSSLLKEITKKIRNNEGNIKQLILLTHNVYFHKEVSFINGRTKECNETNFWILRKIDNISYLQDFELVNPIQNSYELLWRELKNKDNNSGIAIQNTMRRIIENYFKILGKYGDDDLIDKFNNPQEKEICRSLICWINEGSHTIPDDLFVELQDNTIENYFKVFKSIFKETGHIEHYNMMMN
ncbi:AAA family ATPase [Tenacibaculum tangerinum]|uniref:AAA family ATPase n=1 Tax=Tenacibaculum tangerinum TaxID=3038772 RepID=A0ABY8L4S4_9FLAO|nr:AAA family ATPase [Tenacibaculum tangerinum]WGH75029.1 AAA family ATPase [Tenacibaculum tangerinum]